MVTSRGERTARDENLTQEVFGPQELEISLGLALSYLYLTLVEAVSVTGIKSSALPRNSWWV